MTCTEKVMYFIENIKTLENDITTLAKSPAYKEFYHDILRDMLHREMKVIPTTPVKFIRMLTSPISTWGYFTEKELNDLEQEGIPRELRFIDGEYGINEELSDILLLKKSLKEERSGPVYKAMMHCRKMFDEGNQERDWQEAYQHFRHFLVNHRTTNINTRNRMVKDWDETLQKFLFSCYEVIPGNAQFICPRCGWTVFEGSKKRKCITKKCKVTFNTATLKRINKRHDIRLKDVIQLTTAIPTDTEFAFYELVRKLGPGLTITWYPDIERKGDFLIKTARKEYYIDIKEYQQSGMLAKELISKKKTIQTPYIVVSDDKSKNYIENLNDLLKEANIRHFRVYSFSNMLEILSLDMGVKPVASNI